MALETATYIADLVATNPTATDPVGQGDDHLRMLKSVLQTTFPNLGGRFGRIIDGSAGYTVLSTDNTAYIRVPTAAGATVTHTVSLPALSSITAGFTVSLDVPGVLDHVVLVPTGGASIEGAASHRFLPQTGGRVFYDGTQWRVQKAPIASEGGFGYYFASTLTVSGEAVFKGNVSVAGAVQVGGALGVTGGSTFNAAASFSASVIMQGSLRVEGATTMSGAVLMQSTLTVSGQAYFVTTMITQGAAQVGGAFSVGGATTLASTLTVSGAAVLLSSLNVAGATTLASTLTVSGATALLSSLDVAGNLSVSGTAIFSNDLKVGGVTTFSGASTFKTTVSVGGAAVLGSTLHVDGTASFSSTVVLDALLDLQVGQIKFPAAQNASADANTLDDYEEGTFTPSLTFDTAGDLSVAYTIQSGSYTKIGRLVVASAVIQTSTFTHTTSSGNLRIGGLPFTVVGSNFSGLVLSTNIAFGAGRTAAVINPQSSTDYANMLAYGTSTSSNTIDSTEHTTGDNVVLRYTAIYHG